MGEYLIDPATGSSATFTKSGTAVKLDVESTVSVGDVNAGSESFLYGVSGGTWMPLAVQSGAEALLRVAGTFSATEASVEEDLAPVPASGTYVGGNFNGSLYPLRIETGSELLVTGSVRVENTVDVLGSARVVQDSTVRQIDAGSVIVTNSPNVLLGSTTLHGNPNVLLGSTTLHGNPNVLLGSTTLHGNPNVLLGSTTLHGTNTVVGSVNVDSDFRVQVFAGSIVTTSDSGIAIAASTPSRKVTVQSVFANTVPMYVGNATNQHVQLNPGDSIDINVANLGSVYIRRSGGTQVTAAWIGE